MTKSTWKILKIGLENSWIFFSSKRVGTLEGHSAGKKLSCVVLAWFCVK